AKASAVGVTWAQSSVGPAASACAVRCPRILWNRRQRCCAGGDARRSLQSAGSVRSPDTLGRMCMYARLLVVLAFVGFAANAWAQQDKDDKKLLDGTWIPVTAELAGQKSTLAGTKLVLAGDKYKLLSGETVTDQGSIVLDTDKKPRAMDIKGE